MAAGHYLWESGLTGSTLDSLRQGTSAMPQSGQSPYQQVYTTDGTAGRIAWVPDQFIHIEPTEHPDWRQFVGTMSDVPDMKLTMKTVTPFAVVSSYDQHILLLDDFTGQYCKVRNHSVGFYSPDYSQVNPVTMRLKSLKELSDMVKISLTEKDLYFLGMHPDVIVLLGCEIVVYKVSNVVSMSNISKRSVDIYRIIDPFFVRDDFLYSEWIYLPETVLKPEVK